MLRSSPGSTAPIRVISVDCTTPAHLAQVCRVPFSWMGSLPRRPVGVCYTSGRGRLSEPRRSLLVMVGAGRNPKAKNRVRRASSLAAALGPVLMLLATCVSPVCSLGGRMPSTIERKIFFYKGITGNDERGRPLPLDLTRALQQIDQLEYTPAGRYQDDADGNGLLAVIDGPSRIRLGVTRRTGLPLLERAGHLEELRIPRTAGLFEPTHLVLFPDGIIGAEFNFYGPRASRLPKYLGDKASGLFAPFSLATLARQDIVKRLGEFSDIRGVEIQVRRSELDILAEADKDLARSMKLAADASGADTIDYVLKPKRASTMGAKARQLVRSVIGRADFREHYDKLRLRGVNSATDAIEPLDLLRDDLIAVRQIL